MAVDFAVEAQRVPGQPQGRVDVAVVPETGG